MSLAIRNLLKDKTRLVLSVSGVALAVMLILLLNGFLTGMNRQITSYLDRSPGLLVISQRGVLNLLGANSLLPPGVVADVNAAPGVARAVPILSQFVILDLHGQKQAAYLIGYNPEEGGGPWNLAAGREPQVDSEMVFDRILAERHGLEIGAQVEVFGQKFKIAGLSDGTTSWMTSFFFLRKSAVERLIRLPGAASFLLVEPQPTQTVEALRERLEDLEGVEIQTKTEMASNDLKLFSKVFSIPLRLMVGIAFLVGILVVGLIIYTATVERQREYGALKAIGAWNGFLYRVVSLQALAAAIAGYLLGLALTWAAAEGIMRLRPQFLIALEPAHIGWSFLAAIGMALAAALFPARLVAGLAPVEVFRK